MADYDLKSITPAASIAADTEMVFGAADQTSGTPKPYQFSVIKTWIKSWIVKADVGLGNVSNALQLVAANNLSDLANVATAKSNLSLTKSDVGLGNVVNSLQAIAANNLSDLTDFVAARSNLQMGYGALRNRFYIFTDCLGGTADFGWQLASNGTGAGTSVIQPGSLNAVGIVSLDLGTTTTGRSALTGNGGATPSFLKFGADRSRFQAKMAIHVLSNGTDTFTTRAGFMDSVSAEPTDGCYFRYTDGVNSGKWQAVTRSNGTETATDTGVAPVADTWHLMSIDVNAAGTSVVFAIDGSTVTNTTNIPTGAGRETGYAISANKSAGTTGTSGAYVDFAEVEINFASQR